MSNDSKPSHDEEDEGTRLFKSHWRNLVASMKRDEEFKADVAKRKLENTHQKRRSTDK